jgi:hypothetical protein
VSVFSSCLEVAVLSGHTLIGDDRRTESGGFTSYGRVAIPLPNGLGSVVTYRSGLGITNAGRLIWAGGEHLTVAALAHALLGAGLVRAVQLDVNSRDLFTVVTR